MTSRFAVAKAAALDGLEGLVPELLGAGPRRCRKAAGGFYCASPGSPRPAPDQMVVWRTGARRGGWKDFVAGASGDVIDLVAYVEFGAVTAESRIAAVEWIEQRFGLRALAPAQRAGIAAAHEKRRQELEARDAAERAERADRARKMFHAAAPEISGTVVETYLAARGIALGEVPQLAPSFRLMADCEHWLSAPRAPDGRKAGPGPRFPAMVSAMRDGAGALAACHLTYLAPDGRGKAPVEKAKLMWPATAGLVVRVTLGPSGLACEDAAAAGRSGLVGLTEGIEDAMTAGLAAPTLRMHAAGSLPGLASVPDLPCASGYVVFRDNDWDKPQAVALFERAVARIKGFGKPVELVSIPADWGKDVNDVLNDDGEKDGDV